MPVPTFSDISLFRIYFNFYIRQVKKRKKRKRKKLCEFINIEKGEKRKERNTHVPLAGHMRRKRNDI
jgi:hypothetical protein